MGRHVLAQLWYLSDAPHGVTFSNHIHICPSPYFWRRRYSPHCDMQQITPYTSTSFKMVGGDQTEEELCVSLQPTYQPSITDIFKWQDN
jgi:hypothetical protein